ncbi:hypothetical protein [Pantoea sp. 1B4]|uniref:hypothetical protein n=1 Tax=Pantoea sp. 1B4 TaxID=2804760 RepID=UPI001AA25B4D|nr:hypothetical protein [Pantoea sp. 1B4]MBN1090845.1 hypothetical protein [Pantoea sp. 1B4]
MTLITPENIALFFDLSVIGTAFITIVITLENRRYFLSAISICLWLTASIVFYLYHGEFSFTVIMPGALAVVMGTALYLVRATLPFRHEQIG